MGETTATSLVNDLLLEYQHKGDNHDDYDIRIRAGYVTEVLLDL